MSFGIASSISLNNYNTNRRLYIKSLQRISTGFRINSASDDASGLAIADKLRTQASSIRQGIENANSAISLVQIADKAIGEQSYILDVLKAKLIQANTSTTSDAGREAIRKDITKLLEQLDNIAEQTNYNGISLLQKNRNSQEVSSELSFQVGESSRDIIKMEKVQANTQGLKLSALKNIVKGTFTKEVAQNSQTLVDEALTKLNSFRSDFGSTQNQLESQVRYMLTMETNIKASESIIRDVDYAEELYNLNKLNIMMQAGMYAIAQANKIQQQMISRLLN